MTEELKLFPYKDDEVKGHKETVLIQKISTDETGERETETGKHPEAETGVKAIPKRSPRDYPPYNVSRILKTLAAYIIFFGGGIGYSIYGATILHLEKQTGSTTKHMAYIFTYRALGSITGNILIGVLFNKVPSEALLCAASLLFAATNIAVPFCLSLGLLIAIIMVNGFSMGILGGGCNSYMLKTWRLRTRPFLQALHCVISVGASISPLIVKAFVTDNLNSSTTSNLTTEGEDPDQLVKQDYMQSSNSSNSLYSTLVHHHTSITESPVTVSQMQLFYPFLTGGLFAVSAAILFAVLLVVDVQKHLKKSTGVEGSVKSFIKLQEENLGTLKHKLILVLMVLITMIYGGMEYTYGSWILTFSVKHLGVSFQTAASITTAYWSSFAGGRALSVFTAKFISPVKTLIVSFVSSTVALVLLTLLSTAHIAVVWVCSVVIGVTFAPIFGNCLTFTQKEVNMPSRMTTLFVFMLYLGFIGMPALVGFLFTSFSPIAFLYVVAVGGVLNSTIFAAVLFYRYVCIKRK